MAEDSKESVVLAESVAKVLDLQAKHGMDQETMLIYMCSVNLTSILSLIGQRYPGSSSGYIQPSGGLTAPIGSKKPEGGTASTEPLGALNNMGEQGANPNALLNLLNSFGGAQGGGQGLNPALMTSLLGALGGGQNTDLGSLMNLMTGLMGAGANHKPRPAETPKEGPAAPQDKATNAAKGMVKNDRIGNKKAIREVPKVMKWDSIR